jgi:hypothetical protein
MKDKNFLLTETYKWRFEMAESTLTAIGRVTKKAIIGALKGTGEKSQTIVETTADLVKVTIEGVGDFTVAVEKRAGEIVSGAIEAATEVGGGDLFMTIKSTVYGIVKAGSNVGADVATTAVAATEGAIKAAAKAGTDINEATKEAVTGAIEAGDEIGTHASKAVRDALTTSVNGAKDVIKPPSK